MADKYDFTARPENPRLFLASEMASALDITMPCFYSLARKLELDNVKQPDGRGHMVLYFTHDALGLCREELERRELAKKKPAKKIEPIINPAEHPLVKDARFFKLSYFPDVVPVCFAEVTE